ncbi:MAG: CapA family protein [Candidatus Thermoplasmatota archaeon]|nr:CapA family protein [Candidatus Thermoplasmatota archaeon]
MIGDAYSGDPSLTFNYIKPLFEDKQDIIVNLETAITDNRIIANPGKTYNYKINESVVQELKFHNITLLNLANNHILDYGITGLNDSIQCIQNYDFLYFGAGYDETSAREGVVKIYEESTKIGYLGYFEYSKTYDQIYHFYAKNEIPGVAELNSSNLESDISKMKEKADIVIVSFHIGDNYDTSISSVHQSFARYAIDKGADAVVCHSSHIVLPVELYKGKIILYSIGNFIFTTPGRFDYVDEVYHVGMGAEFIIKNKKINSLKLTPFKTNNKEINFQPIFLNITELRLLSEIIIPSNLNIKFENNSIILD